MTTEYAVTDPATGETVATYPTASDADIEGALAAAEHAYRSWARTAPLAERADRMRRAAELLRERKHDFARTARREMGKPLDQAVAEVELSADILADYADNAETYLADDELDVSDGRRTVVRKQPLGVLLGIMPWNYPVYQIARFAGPNLVLGNTIVLKHAEQCPETALALEQLFLDAGFPTGAYVNVFASHDQIGTVIADPRVQGVSLTGSERAGAIIAEQAGRALKKCVLELGGSDPLIVLDVADLDHAVQQAVSGRMENAGQACNGSKRIIVHADHYDEFTRRFVAALSELVPDRGEHGDGADDPEQSGDYGPLSSARATETLASQVDRAVEQGARLLLGGTPEGNYYPPTVLTDITPDMDAYREEFFGPVAQLYRVSSDDEAIDLANASPYGLGSVVICDDTERAQRAGELLEVGMVFLGSAGLEGPDVPFGGVKRSGYGREMGPYGIEEFANKKLFRYAD